MSNAVFPSTRYAPGVTKRPQFTTIVQRAASLREIRGSLTAYPAYSIDLQFQMLSQAEFETLCGFFLQRRGSFDSFLFTDPADNTVANQTFGNGDGVRTGFQATRALGGFVEPCENIRAVSAVTEDGTPVIGITVGATGIINFEVAPADGAELNWTGTFYHRCRFAEDAAEFEQFSQRLYRIGRIQLIGAPGNKV